MPQHYQFSKPGLNLGPSTIAHVDHAKYLLKILVLLSESLVESTLMHFFFIKKGIKSFKIKLRILRFFYTVGPIIHTKNYIIVNTISFKNFYLYYI